MDNTDKLPPFAEWFEAKHGVPFPARVGDDDFYEVIVPRAFAAMSEYMDEIRKRALDY